MRSKSFFVALAALLLLSFGLTYAQNNTISISDISNSWVDGPDTKITPGVPIVFTIHFAVDNPEPVAGIANGYRIWTLGATGYTPITIDTVPLSEGTPFPPIGWGGIGYAFGADVFFDLKTGLNLYSATGSGSDSCIFLGAKGEFGVGMYGDFNGDAVLVGTGNIEDGETLCIDSTYCPPTGSWAWSPPPSEPTWYTEPQCFLAGIPPDLPPEITNCNEGNLSLTGSHCDLATFTFEGADPDQTEAWEFYKVSGVGAVTAAGVFSYQPTLADVGASLDVVVEICGNAFGAFDHCNVSQCTVNLSFSNDAPVITGGCGGPNPLSSGSTVTVQMTATDDCDDLSWTIPSHDTFGGTVDIDANTGLLTFTADIADEGLVNVEVEVTDTDETTTCTVIFDVTVGSLYQVVIGPSGECVGDQEGDYAFQGQHINVPINLMAQGGPIGGFDFLIAYGGVALSFQMAELGPDLVACGWEYFTYRFGPNGNCGNACPSGMLEVVGIAETNNGPNHPTCFGGTVLVNLDFLVTSDATFQCTAVPVRFFWTSCADNALSDKTGDSLFIAEAIYDGYDPLSPIGKQNIFDPEYGSYPTYAGPQNFDCFLHETKIPFPKVSFENGCVWIACADSIDDRGDLNLNQIPNEIADAVLYSNYMIYGMDVFDADPIRRQGQIAASDVNNDGLTLSVADLVYLIRIITGDALPYDKISPVAVTFTADDGILTVEQEMAAALVTIEGPVTPTLVASNMDIRYAYDASSNATRVLVYSMSEGQTFSGNFLNANGNVISTEFATYNGATVSSKLVPANFSLNQNYPNPFNPTTTLSFALPVASDYTLTIFNVTGQRVEQFSGSASEAGVIELEWDASEQASGVYFYKLNAGNFTDTKKMVLLK